MNDIRQNNLSEDDQPVFLEGMKVMFDERVGLYPVDLIKQPQKVTQDG
ncbi:MAG: hypothetical protein ACOCW2_00510 [Chitinivibrionales bacterium]